MTRLPLTERADLLVRCLELEKRLYEMQQQRDEARCVARLYRKKLWRERAPKGQTMTIRSKGRRASAIGELPSRERVLAALTAKAEHGAAMAEAAQQLPREVKLADGRILKQTSDMAGGYAYRCRDGMVVIATYDQTPHGLLLHVSVSYADRDPRWKELKLLRAAFYPAGVDVIQVLPREGQYVNFHKHAFHLFQAPAAWEGGWNV